MSSSTVLPAGLAKVPPFPARDGTEIDLLWIVHVACLLSDTLGFAVVPPRVGLAVGEVVDASGHTLGEKPRPVVCAYRGTHLGGHLIEYPGSHGN
jgi:hypothetical protein